MTLTNLDKAPFPWFGGKSKAAPLVWELLGDVPHYCEPFAGSLAVLLNRPHPCNRPYYSETVNDLDALLVNAWRAIQWHPEETAGHASWPVSENDEPERRIVLAGFDGEHDNQLADLGWTEHEWFTAGHLIGGYGGRNQQDRERLWASLHCLTPGITEPDPQQNMFDQ